MSRKVHRVHYALDTQGIRSISPEEIRAILRAADALIMQGGQSLLVKNTLNSMSFIWLRESALDLVSMLVYFLRGITMLHSPSCWLLAILCLMASMPAWGQSLSSLERKLVKEPVYQGVPEYGLLVLGSQMEKKIWLVRDGGTLYIDLAGDGDLTRPEAKWACNAKASSPSEIEYVFDIGKLPNCPGEPSDFQVVTRRLSALPEVNNAIKQTLARDANAITYMIYLQNNHPVWKGKGVHDRLVHMIGPIDHRGVLLFSKHAATAPIMHVDGPLQIVPYGQFDSVRAGNSTEIVTSIGTPGLGSGTTAYLGFEKTIPTVAKPVLEVTFPKGEKQQLAVKAQQVLHERCCTINLYGKLQVPEEVGAGTAAIQLRLADWKEGNVAPSESSIEILPKAVKAIPQTVSLEPTRRLHHQDRQGYLYQLEFSADGSKLFASSYPGGVLQWWDVKSGEQLRSLETGKGSRGSASYSMLTPDWKAVWVGEEQRGKIEEIEKEGKKYLRWTFDGRLRAWDPATGAAIDPIIPPDGRSFHHTEMSPDGRYIAALEQISGTFPREQGRVQKMSVYDVQTRQKLPFPDNFSFFSKFTHDSKHLLVQELANTAARDTLAWHLVSIPEGKVLHTLKTAPGAYSYVYHVSHDNQYVYMAVTTYESPKNFRTFTRELQCWNVTTGKKVNSISLGDQHILKNVAYSDNDQWMVATNQRNPNPAAKVPSSLQVPSAIEVYSLPELKHQATIAIPFPKTGMNFAFHPQQPIVVHVFQNFPPAVFGNGDIKEDEVEQPKLMWINLKEGRILRTDILPPCFPGHLKFSPDGKTLAVCTKGNVHLYEVPSEVLK